MKKLPEFLEDTAGSLGGMVEGKPRLIHTVKQRLAEALGVKRVLVGKRAELSQEMREREKKIQETAAALHALEAEMGDIEVRNETLLAELREQYEILVGSQDSDRRWAEREALKITDATEEVRRMALVELNNCTENIVHRWERAEYSEADIQKYFSEEYLAKLNVDEYAILLRRFPCEMVTHVTRQGVRDHWGLESHQGGMGQFTDGFSQIIEEGRLHSLLGKCTTQEMKEEAIIRMLKLKEFISKEEALAHFRRMTSGNHQGEPGVYSDDAAIHFAAEEVADNLYGAERGNEIFFAFPSLFIASNYFHEGHLTEGGGGYWNDRWVWTQEHKGIDVQTGLVFIPAAAQVDRMTGSRYKLDENKKAERTGDSYMLATDTISSRDYWETYFAAHPEKRPSKIVYYEGGDPTAALNQWRGSAGLRKFAGEKDLTIFEKQNIGRGAPIAMHGSDRFLSIAEAVIEKYFA